MYIRYVLIVLSVAVGSSGQSRKCDQTPPQAISEPITTQSLFQLTIGNAKENHFVAQQTYLLTLEALTSKKFTWFMITAEDPHVDENVYDFGHKEVNVGSLKSLDPSKSRYSEKCANTLESFDNMGKHKVEVHWVSPSDTDTEVVRIRAMVAENAENWYTGENLTIELTRDTSPPKDDPPLKVRSSCHLCSEARYEVTFKGRWSRLEHPRHYPSKPDDNGYSHMIGASHHPNFTLWEPGVKATHPMAVFATKSEITLLERFIIDNMSEKGGTRTLIRGKKRHHPNMHKWSHSLFRVDRYHHLFTVVVAMRPSPDWFLGTKKFELCTDRGWLKEHSLPLYPWDAGVMDGVSYESIPTVTNPEGNIERVEVGSFNAESPFFQTNLNDLKPYAFLEIRRLDVYPLDPEECSDEDDNNQFGYRQAISEEEPLDEPQEEPVIAESRQKIGCHGEWSDWSPCVPDVGGCGIGAKTRMRINSLRYDTYDNEDIQVFPLDGSCQANGDPNPMEIKDCIVKC